MKRQENWKIIPGHESCKASDSGLVKVFNGKNWKLSENVNGYVIIDNELIFVPELLKKTFSLFTEKKASRFHNTVLLETNLLRFIHLVPTPSIAPEVEQDGLRIWYVQDGFICCAPMRSFMQGNSKFVFPYKVGGNRTYMCGFDEIRPLKYRQVRNSGTVQIIGNKLPIPYRKAIGMIYKKLMQAQKAKSKWIDGKTKLKKSYINNTILNVSNSIKPVVVYNHTVYTLFVDFMQLHAEYRELTPQDHIVKLYNFVDTQKPLKNDPDPLANIKHKLWCETYNFTERDFLKLIDECS